MDLTVEQEAPQPIPAVLPHAEPSMHVVILYEVRGWVLASVVVAGFPASVFVLAGPNEHLDDLYQLVYDNESATYDFLRLAYDHDQPIVPIAVPGDSFPALADTYGLRGI